MDGLKQRAHIPEHAAIVFTGVRCVIYQWEQEMFDGSIGIFEKIVRIPAATAIATVGDKVLIQEQEQPHRSLFYSLPGGHADSYEEPLLEVAKRELKEEAGLVSEDWEIEQDISRRDFTVFEHNLYIARNCQKKFDPEFDGGEKIVSKYVTVEDLFTILDDPLWRHKDIAEYLKDTYTVDTLKQKLFA